MNFEEGSRLKRTLIVLSLVTLSCLLFARLVYLYLSDTNRFPINTIKVAANYQHITRTQIESILSQYHSQSFYTLPVHQLYHQLITMSWVAQVDIERLFPDTIKITLKEKQPIAIWNDAILTDQGDSVTESASTAEYPALPRLVGAPQDAKLMLTMYQKMSAMLAFNQLQIKILERRENHAWEITLTNGTRLKLGKVDTLERLERFSRAYRLLSDKPGQLVYVDLRYPKGMAVKWQPLISSSGQDG
ncbi:MAG: cell division protein FtsQ/DivIB [Gammaproteobacteria bacterium]|nr:cell division protein FtsQ/DivIB [Gammaproteobacteria bacterium]